jgi:hypothetical protein
VFFVTVTEERDGSSPNPHFMCIHHHTFQPPTCICSCNKVKVQGHQTGHYHHITKGCNQQRGSIDGGLIPSDQTLGLVHAPKVQVPHVKDWWDNFCEQKETEETSLFSAIATWESFRDSIKEQYYLVESYDDLYTKWTTLQLERDQEVPDFTNIFHTLRTKLGVKDSK